MKIIAEVGVNFKDMEEAFKFIDKSKELGLFATKFQIFNESNIEDAPKEYQPFLKSIILTKLQIHQLFEYGKSIEQIVFFTPMYREIIPFLREIGVNYYKVRFKDRFNTSLIWDLMDTNKPIFFSTDYERLLENDPFISLFCIPEYPANHRDYIDKSFNTITGTMHFKGISDHTPDFHLFYIMSHYQFEYWEKHVCLTKDCLESKWSCTFEELKEVIRK